MCNPLRTAVFLVALAFLTLPGCGSDELNSPTAVKLKAVASFYLDYAVAKNGKGPTQEEHLKRHVQGLPDFVVRMNGADPTNLADLYVSGRDQEPFVIRYGVSISGMSGNSAPVVAHEKTGKNGKVLVAYANTKVDHVDEARLQELIAAKP
jgi:hypothetical protein